MGRPHARADATMTANEGSIARGRDRQRRLVKADRELRTAMNDLDDAQDRVTEAETEICELHRRDEKLCRTLRAENVMLSQVPA